MVIACGGGGIPVLAQNNRLQGASAVIEKDLAAGKLAELLDADMLVILTSVDKVCLNYGKEDEIKLDTLSLAEAKKYLEEGQFEAGTMAPKIEAAIDFIGDAGRSDRSCYKRSTAQNGGDFSAVHVQDYRRHGNIN